MDAARIEEVVGEFVQLKKRGVNYIGLCPFHNEKTPSFTVSHTKGIFKCFGCGKSGNSVGFVMEHEHFTYREALKFLATKYNIAIEEKERTNEEVAAENIKESLYIVNAYAQNYFSNYLLHSDEGKTIGLSYFKERGLTEATIEKFKLGFCPSAGDTFTRDALKAGYKGDILKQLGLTSQYNQDFFRGRVLFTIHSVSGKVTGFGGRTLQSDKKIPKYVNSPETEIYVKSKIVYGIYQARKPIAEKDECFLVEGYMDVISLSQAGIENVVASSGTSLTQDQVRLIKRYTKNLTIIYDGDTAGVKAALRGLEIALEEGLNVKVVLLPAEDDPDTLVRKLGMEGFLSYVKKEKKDLIHLKTNLFLEEAQNDPVKIAHIVKDIVQSISLVPDPITRSLYIKQTAAMLHVEEQILISEINKILRKKAIDKVGTRDKASAGEDLQLPVAPQQIRQSFKFYLDEEQEKDVIRLLLENSNYELDGEQAITRILRNLENVEIENQLYNKVIEEYKNYYEHNEFISQVHFLNHEDDAVKTLCLNILQSPYELSENWSKMHGVHITNKLFLAGKDIVKTISLLKLKKMIKMKMDVDEKIKELQEKGMAENMDEILMCQKEAIDIQGYIRQLSKDTGIVVMPVVK
ncbi:MAG: DNA primase [Chitinophagales bacterium]|nr:DNA primase [Chitinophagales bacterium]